jgi:hypothetical protein
MVAERKSPDTIRPYLAGISAFADWCQFESRSCLWLLISVAERRPVCPARQVPGAYVAVGGASGAGQHSCAGFGRAGPCVERDGDMADPGLAAGPHGERYAASGPSVSETESLHEDGPARLRARLARMVGRSDHAGLRPVRVVDDDMAAGRRCDHHGDGRAWPHGYWVLVFMRGVGACTVRVHRVPRIDEVQRPDDKVAMFRRYRACRRCLGAGEHQRFAGTADAGGRPAVRLLAWQLPRRC